MKILQVASYFDPHYGGIERHVRCLSDRLSNEGHDVTVLTTNIPRTKKDERIGKLRILRFEAPLRPMGNPLAIGMLKGLLSMRDFDIVHSHDEHAFTSNLAALTHHMDNQHLVVSCHGSLAYTNPLEKLILNAYEKTLMYATLGSAEAVICLSESDKHHLHVLGVERERISVIPNAIDLPTSITTPNNRPNGGLILCVSQLLERKGIETLVEAMEGVHEACRNAKLLIVGEGKRMNELLRMSRQKGLEEVIAFRGRISREGLEEAYAACDVLVLPSYAEGLPTVILEAMARQRAVIATNIPSVWEYFSRTAMLVPPRDPIRLRDAMIRVLNDEDLRSRLAREGRALIERRFTWDIVARQIVDLYERILNQ